MYVTDSLFFLQHILANNENDEDRQIFSIKFREIVDSSKTVKPQESAVDIKERMIKKSQILAGE